MANKNQKYIGKTKKALRERNEDNTREYSMLYVYKKLMEERANTQTKIKTANAESEQYMIAQYPKPVIGDIKILVLEKKWLSSPEHGSSIEMNNIPHRLTQPIKELEDRYESSIPKQTAVLSAFAEKVNAHLKKMSTLWK